MFRVGFKYCCRSAAAASSTACTSCGDVGDLGCVYGRADARVRFDHDVLVVSNKNPILSVRC